MATSSQSARARASVGLPIYCPNWCENEPCNGEHFGHSDDYVPATAGLPLRLDHSMGVSFPAIGVALAWNTIDHGHPAVSLHVSGSNVDTQADMQLHEAEKLLESLKRAIETLRSNR